jgi:hypothetical protein
MNVAEINDSSKITLGRAMAWTIPLSLAIISVLLMGVQNEALREFFTDLFAIRGALREKVRERPSPREHGVEDRNGQTDRQERDMV